MRFFHARKNSLQFQTKRKGASGLRAHQQQLGINQVFECFSTLLAKMRMVKGIGALVGGKYLHLHVFGISVANLINERRTAGLDNKNLLGATGVYMQLKHQNDFSSHPTLSMKNQLVPFCCSFLLRAPGYQQKSPLKLVPGPCETRRPNDWRSFPAPLAALWLHEALPSFQDSSLCRERVPLGRALWGNSCLFVDKMSKDEGGVPKKHPFESEKIVYTEILRWTILYCSTRVVV